MINLPAADLLIMLSFYFVTRKPSSSKISNKEPLSKLSYLLTNNLAGDFEAMKCQCH